MLNNLSLLKRTFSDYVKKFSVISLLPCGHYLVYKMFYLGYVSPDSSECKRK